MFDKLKHCKSFLKSFFLNDLWINLHIKDIYVHLFELNCEKYPGFVLVNIWAVTNQRSATTEEIGHLLLRNYLNTCSLYMCGGLRGGAEGGGRWDGGKNVGLYI